MRAPPNVYAYNGHERTYRFTSISNNGEPLHMGTMSIFTNDIIANVSGVQISITRQQAATVIRKHRLRGHTVRGVLQHYPDKRTCGSSNGCAGTDIRYAPTKGNN